MTSSANCGDRRVVSPSAGAFACSRSIASRIRCQVSALPVTIFLSLVGAGGRIFRAGTGAWELEGFVLPLTIRAERSSPS